MRYHPALVRALLPIGALLVTASCSGSDSQGVAPPPTKAPEQLVLTLSPRIDTIAVGSARSLTASATVGGVARNVDVAWSSSNPAIASVSGGVVTGVAFGRATIHARAGAAVDSAVVVILPAQIEMTISPNAVSAALGDTIDFEIQSRQGIATPDVVWHVSDTTAARLVKDGSLSTIGEGTVQLTAQLGVQQAVATVKVSRAPATSISVTPNNASMIVGATQQFTATVYDSRGRTTSGDLTWASSNAGVASVNATGLVTARSAGGAILTVTSGNASATVSINVASSPASSITLSTSPDSLGVKQTLQASVTAYDASGAVITGRPVAYQSSNPSVATVNSSGLITGLVGGQTTISAICDGLVASRVVRVVAPVPTTLAVTPASNIITLGSTTQLVAEVRDQFGNAMSGQTIAWTSQDVAIASVAAGKVTGVAIGTTTVRAAVGTLSTNASVTVQNIPVASVSISPTSASVEQGKTVTLTATARDANGNVLANRPVTFAAANAAVAYVSPTGVVTGELAGSTTVTATIEGKTATASITVTPPPPAPVASVSLTLNSPALNVGQTTQATARTYDANGVELLGRSVTYSSVNPTIATVNASGLVTAVASGTVVISATSEGKTGNASLTISATVSPVATVTLTASKTALSIPDSAALNVQLKDANGNTLTGRTISYSSSNPSVLTVSASGLAKSVAEGSATVTATSEGKSASLGFTVTAPVAAPQPVATVSVAVNSSSVVVGQGTQATATLRDANGNALTGRTVSWSSSAPGVATVTQAGYVTGVSAGSAVISATSEGVTGSTNVSVKAPVATVSSVRVTLASASITVGQTTTATATALDASGASISGLSVSWTIAAGSNVATLASSTTSTVTVSGANAGSTSVVATIGGISGSVGLTVTQPASLTPVTLPAQPTLLSFSYPNVTGKSWVVRQGDNLQTVLNSAVRGDEIVIDAGARFVGNFTLPAKSGTAANGWIIIRSSASASLPPQGTRVGPANAALMPKIVTANSSPALATSGATSGWWVSGVELTVDPSVTVTTYRVLALGAAGSSQTSLSQVPMDLVFDRVYIHPQANQTVQRCVELNSGRTQISDSYLFDCHAKGMDSQAILGWNGPGPFKIVNNMLAGAGENVMFGGADPSISGLIPSDIEMRRNYVYTPASWKGVWTKKNLIETKNSQRWLMEGNVFDGSWSDGQTGFAFVLKVSSNSSTGGGCTWCVGRDITIRNNVIRNVGAGFGITGVGSAGMVVGEYLNRVLIENNILESVNTGIYTGEARLISIMNSAKNVTIRGNTLTSTGSVAQFVYAATNPASDNFTFENNIVSHGSYGFFSSWYGIGEASLQAYTGTKTLKNYIMIGSSRSGYPNGRFVSDLAAAEATGVGANRASVLSATNNVAIP